MLVNALAVTFAIPIEKLVIVPVGDAVETFIPKELIFPVLTPEEFSSEASMRYWFFI